MAAYSGNSSIDPSWELRNQMSMLQNHQNLEYNYDQGMMMMGLCSDNLEYSNNNNNNNNNNSCDDEDEKKKKRKAEELLNRSTSFNSSLTSNHHPITKKTNSSSRGKRAKSSEKPEEVVHVRARRGQATDSHSIAERVRRGKINERLKCLQDIVPGCYKTMGMAVMLDEIINYVQSLQNQVEFLSLKLTAASQYHDFNVETEDIDKMQKMKAQNMQELQRMMSNNGGNDQGLLANFFQQTWPLGFN